MSALIAFTHSAATEAASPATITSNANGTATVNVANNTATITAFDASNNATAINGNFTGIISADGNAAGQLCVANGNTLKSQYSYVLATATEVGVEELKGKSFTEYEDCRVTGQVSINADGSMTFYDGTAPASLVAAVFSPQGLTETENGVTSYTKGKAYKQTINGQVRYYFIFRGHDVPGQNDDYVTVGVQKTN